MGKFTLLLGIAIGFVIGAAAGRQRYEQLKGVVTDVANKPQVQRAVKKADDFIADKAPAVHDIGEAITDAAKPTTSPATSSPATS